MVQRHTVVGSDTRFQVERATPRTPSGLLFLLTQSPRFSKLKTIMTATNDKGQSTPASRWMTQRTSSIRIGPQYQATIPDIRPVPNNRVGDDNATHSIYRESFAGPPVGASCGSWSSPSEAILESSKTNGITSVSSILQNGTDHSPGREAKRLKGSSSSSVLTTTVQCRGGSPSSAQEPRNLRDDASQNDNCNSGVSS